MEQLSEELVLLGSPARLVDGRVKHLSPTLAALVSRALAHMIGNASPIARKHRNSLSEPFVLLVRPRTLLQALVETVDPALAAGLGRTLGDFGGDLGPTDLLHVTEASHGPRQEGIFLWRPLATVDAVAGLRVRGSNHHMS